MIIIKFKKKKKKKHKFTSTYECPRVFAQQTLSNTQAHQFYNLHKIHDSQKKNITLPQNMNAHELNSH